MQQQTKASPMPTRWASSRRRHLIVALALTALLLVTGVLYGAYGYLPAEAGRSYRFPYLRAAPSRFVDTPVARFHYLHAGTGSPVILVAPGAASVIGWRDQLPALARHHSVWVVELPGQGHTRLQDRRFRWDLAAMTDALGSFMDAVGIRRAALAGNSWSGGWVLAFAQRQPKRVSRLALLDASGLDIRDPWSWEILKYPVIGELVTNLTGASKSTVRSWAHQVLINQDIITDELIDEWWAPLTFHDNLRGNYLLERRLDWSETDRALPDTRTPTLVIWGEQDTVLPAWQARKLGQRLPNAQVKVLDRCGHAVQLDCPERVNRLLEGFLARP
jgi:pimeloyl-ACP methyl ester carboxylesterase